jgi:hypothetical protein
MIAGKHAWQRQLPMLRVGTAGWLSSRKARWKAASAQGKLRKHLYPDPALRHQAYVKEMAKPTRQSAGTTVIGMVRCAFCGGILHSKMLLDPTPTRLKLLHACDQ